MECSLALAYAIRSALPTRSGRIGSGALVVSGVGQVSAAGFNLNQAALHELAGVLGIVALPVGALLISRTLARQPAWSSAATQLRWSAHLTWVSVVLFVVSFPVMMGTFLLAQGALPSTPPAQLPHGGIAVVGWTDRLIVLSAWAWVSVTAWHAIRVQRIGTNSQGNRAAIAR